MFLLYNLVLTFTALFWVPWMLLRTAKRAEKPNWDERTGKYPITYSKGAKRVWLHAVSVGEVVAAQPILKELRSLLPDYQIVLSVTTSSGHRIAREQATGLYDHLVYFPLDVPRFQLIAMRSVRPHVVAIMETELWLNFLWAAKVVGARTLVLNARISDRSFPRARWFAFFYRSLFEKVDRVLAQSEQDRVRLSALGAKNVEVFGNCKFDQALEALDTDPGAVREELKIPGGRKVIVIGSTRGEDEEALVIEAIRKIGLAGTVVVHAPRHLERVPELCREVEKAFAHVARRSLGETGDYIVLDTYGELAKVYAIADVVVVGGGFGDYGGQNILQPLALGKPVLHGPHMQNFRDASLAASKAGATLLCSTADDLAEALSSLLGDDEKRSTMGDAAAQMIRASAGASRRYAEAIAAEAATANSR